MRLVISMPVRNDWQAASQLCSRIDLVLSQTPEVRASVLLIDDASDRCADQQDIPSDLQALESIFGLSCGVILVTNAQSR